MATKMESLNDLFIHGLKKVYCAEHQIAEVTPKTIEAASAPELKKNLQEHLESVQRQFKRLEDILEILDAEPETEKCKGMKGITEEAEDIAEMDAPDDVKDAAIIEVTQKMEHYQMAAYGTLRTYARILGHEDIAEKLQRTLSTEKITDRQLSEIAERSVNIQVSGG